MEETGAEPGEPIHVLDGMMPGVSTPKKIEAVLGAVNPVDQKIGDEEGHEDFPKAGEALEDVERSGGDGGCQIADKVADEMSRGAVYGEREGEGEEIELEIAPAVNGPRRPDALADFKDGNEAEKGRNFVIAGLQCHRV